MDQKPIQQHIDSHIYLIRGQNVMLDADLAACTASRPNA